MDHKGARLDVIVLAGLVLYVGMVCFQAYAPFTFIFRDGSFYAQTNRSIAESFTLRQEEFQPSSWYDGSLPWYKNVDDAWSNVSVGAGGEWYPKHSYLMPVFSTPLYILFGPFGLLLFNCIAMVLALFAGYRLASLYAGGFPSAVAVFLVASAPLVQYLAYSYSHDVFCAALVAGGLALLAHRKYAWGGLLLGLSIYAKLTNVLIAAPVGLFLTIGHRRGMLRAAIAAAVPLAVYAVANTLMYGGPFTISYNRILTVENGRQSIVSYSNAFDMPLARGWHRFFSDSHEGELAQMALLPLVAYVCLPFMGLGAWGTALGLAISTGLFLYTFATYHYGGARFFMPWLAVSTVPLAAFLGRLGAAFDWAVNRLSLARRWAFAMAAVPTAVGLLVVAIVWIQSVPSRSMTMSKDVEHLKTTLDGHPCDYFNMTHLKWECSRLDPGGSYLVGRPLGDECSFAHRPMLWAPANPARKTRTITWSPARHTDRFRVFWGLDESSRRGSVRFTIQAGAQREFVAQGRGELNESMVQGMEAGPGQPVTVTIDPGISKGLYLCLDIEAQ
ncbi:MAG: glycosyltransferase family 39 protein [Deltaproteobacteria bacterium]|nr:glycosyltransferase family 39 protein [Deltaproteobacteria bacterium]